MKLKIRYENDFQTIELDAKATDEMWVSLSLDCNEDITQEEKERLIQNAWDEQYNKPEYNNWHKFDRHRGLSKARTDDETDEIEIFEPMLDEVKDSTIFYKETIDRENHWEHESLCEKLYELLKPAAADMVIANGSHISVIEKILNGEEYGTLFTSHHKENFNITDYLTD